MVLLVHVIRQLEAILNTNKTSSHHVFHRQHRADSTASGPLIRSRVSEAQLVFVPLWTVVLCDRGTEATRSIRLDYLSPEP
jgi:hypothetical protein